MWPVVREVGNFLGVLCFCLRGLVLGRSVKGPVAWDSRLQRWAGEFMRCGMGLNTF